MQPRDLLHPRPEGLYCPPGDFFIDPVRPVARALITHGHSDHARPGTAWAVAKQKGGVSVSAVTRQGLDELLLKAEQVLFRKGDPHDAAVLAEVNAQFAHEDEAQG